MPAFLFRCPTTGLRVQGWKADEGSNSEKEDYEPVNCAICARMHFVDTKTGKTLRQGWNDKPRGG